MSSYIKKIQLYYFIGVGLLINPQSLFALQFADPLKDVGNFGDLLLRIITTVIQIAIPLIVLAIIYAGFNFVTAGGSTEKIQSARNMLMWALAGGMIILGAWVIALVIQNTVNSLG